MKPGKFRRCDDRIRVRLIREPGNIVRHRPLEQFALLGHETDVAAKLIRVPGKSVGTVEAHAAHGWALHAYEQPRERRFAGSRGTDDAKRLPRIQRERDPLKNGTGGTLRLIAEISTAT